MFKLLVLAGLIAAASAGLLRSTCLGCGGLIRTSVVAHPIVRSYPAPILRVQRPLIRTAVIGETNVLKTHARAAGGETLSTFETKPAVFADRLAYSAW